MELLFGIGVGGFAASTAAFLSALWRPGERLERRAHALLGATCILWIGVLAWWTWETGAGGGLRTWLGLSAIGLGGLYLVLERRYPIAALGSLVSALATLLAVFALLVAQPREALEGATFATWMLRIHIGLAFIGVTAFAFASSLSLLYLVQSRNLKKKLKGGLRQRLPPLEVLDRLALRGIIAGFPFYTVALLLGSAFALRAEQGFALKSAYVFAVVSWLIYGGVLQARLAAGWRGRRAAWLTMSGLVLSLVVVAQYSLGGG